MLAKDSDEAITVRRLNEMNHLVNDDVLEEILWLFHEFCIQADVCRFVIAASPLRLHPLQEVSGHCHVQLQLPFLYE